MKKRWVFLAALSTIMLVGGAVAQQNVRVTNLTTDVAVDAPSTGNPVYVGGIYESTPSSVSTSGDRTALHTTIDQRLLMTIEDGRDITLGAKTDGKSTATDGTSISVMQVLKQISASVQAPPSQVVTNAGTFAVQDTEATCTGKYYISVGTSEDESEVKASAGTLCGISARNAHASTNAFIKCTNLTAANTTPGSSAIFYEMMVPFGGGYVDSHINVPFDTALTCYIVTGKAASDAAEVAADDVSYFLRYR